jgi:hypothetical protein
VLGDLGCLALEEGALVAADLRRSSSSSFRSHPRIFPCYIVGHHQRDLVRECTRLDPAGSVVSSCVATRSRMSRVVPDCAPVFALVYRQGFSWTRLRLKGRENSGLNPRVPLVTLVFPVAAASAEEASQ